MNKEQFFIIDYGRDVNVVTWEYQNLSDTDIIQITNLTFRCSIDYIDKHNNYNMLIVATTVEFNKLIKILQDNYINCFNRNISDKIIRNKLSVSTLFKDVEIVNETKYNNFTLKVNDWIYENLDLDIVLDLINEKGIDNLREIDKTFLENYGR